MATAAVPTSNIKELTLRGIILGAVITVILTAANVYAGLKIGLTVATSIPAAVISMAILKFFSDSTIQENNIVQTIASAAGTLSAIVFVLPGLVMVGWWTGFPYWLSVGVTAIGGILGVMYSVPLRRALVTGTDLPYPEGVAAAEVLKVGTGAGGVEENRRGLRMIVWSSIVAAAFYLLAQTKILVADVTKAFKFGSGATAASTSLSMLLIGVGHLVGLGVGIAMFVGLLISWVFLVPHYTSLAGQPAGVELGAFVNDVFRNQVRFIGAGAIGVASIWTLLRILGPIISGVRGALAANRERKAGRGDALPLTERDLPIGIVGGSTQSIPRIMARKAGADVSGITWLSVGNNAARAQSLIAKRVEATMVTSTYVPRLMTYDHLHVLADAAQELPDIIYTFEVATEANLAKKRKAFEGFIQATREGVRWALANPDKAAEISVATLPDLPHDETRNAIKDYVKRNFWEATGVLPTKSLAATADLMKESGQLTGAITYDDFVATAFTKA